MTSAVAQAHPDLRQDVVLELIAETPLHVGGLGGDAVIDLPLATDGQDRLFVPGSSWAGVLRAFTRRHLDAGVADELFGVQGADGTGWASRLTVSDSVVGADPGIELRTGVGIDRRTGAAAHRMLHDRLVLPAGSALELRIRYEGPRTERVTELAGLIRSIGLRVGAGTSRGLGRLHCTAATATGADLTSRAGLLAALTGSGAETSVVAATGAVDGPMFEIDWRPLRPVLVGGPAPGESADLVPLLTRTPAGLVPVLPGSSVKGVLRALTERVLRTVLDLPAPSGDAVASSAALAAAVPVFAALFGSAERAAAMSIPDTVARAEPVSPPDWRRYLATGSPVPPWSHERTHVAIDRWTGGAAASRLFTVQETATVGWPAFRVELDETRLPRELWKAAIVLLGTTVGLLREGATGLGHGTSRGLGEIEVTAVTVHGLDRLDLDGPRGTAQDEWWAWLQDTAQGELTELLT